MLRLGGACTSGQRSATNDQDGGGKTANGTGWDSCRHLPMTTTVKATYGRNVRLRHDDYPALLRC